MASSPGSMDAMHDALKKKMELMRTKKHGDGSTENQEGGVTENIMDPDEDDSDHAPDLEELAKTPGDEGVDNDPVSAKLQQGLEKGMDDEHGAHGSMDNEKRHMEILKQVTKGHDGIRDGVPRDGKAGKGLRERANDAMQAKLNELKKKSGMGS